MELSEFRIVAKEIENGIMKNRRNIEEAMNQENSKGNVVNLNKVIRIIKRYEDSETDMTPENEKIAVCYTGKPEITITYILDSIMHNNNVTLCISDNQIFNDILIKIIIESIRSTRFSNEWINYNTNYNEVYIRDNIRHIDKVVYVGDYFEWQRLKSFLKKDVEYNNYGYIKIFIDRAKNSSEYNDIVTYSRKENIVLETYDDIDDFVSESKPEDYSVIFGSIEEINQIKRGLRSGELLINAFPYNSYEFKVNR